VLSEYQGKGVTGKGKREKGEGKREKERQQGKFGREMLGYAVFVFGALKELPSCA
jgi:hypothetical protein